MSYSAAKGFRSEPRFGIDLLRGHRSFRVMTTPGAEGPIGHLRSIAWEYFWQPGVNTSQCLATDIARLIDTKLCAENLHPGSPYAHIRECPRVEPCDFPNMDCPCGFYAYFDHALTWETPTPSPKIIGAVEGWGRVVIGTAGFRAQHAQLVALCEEVSFPFTYTATHPDLAGFTANTIRLDPEARELEARYVVAGVRRAFPNLPVYRDREAMLANYPTLGRPSDKREAGE